MAKITFIRLPDGAKYEVEAVLGESLMEAAIAHHIPRIIGECGGACSCGTCHIYLDKAAEHCVPPMDITEEDMLSFLDKAKANSRLACQIAVTDKMDGLTVYLP